MLTIMEKVLLILSLQYETINNMHEVFITFSEKGMHEKEYILPFISSLKVLGNYGTSKDVLELSVIKEKWRK